MVPFPFKPGALRVVDAPKWGQARVADPTGHSITLMCSVQTHADAAAEGLCRLASVEEENERLRAAVERLNATPPILTTELARLRAFVERVAGAQEYGASGVIEARRVLRGEPDDIDELLADMKRAAVEADLDPVPVAAEIGGAG